MTRAIIVECDEQQATFSNGDMLQFSDDSINLTDDITVNGMDGYCISLDYYDDYTGDYECYYDFFQTVSGWIYPILYCNYEYEEEGHYYYVSECELDGDTALSRIKAHTSKNANVAFWRAMYEAVQAMQD